MTIPDNEMFAAFLAACAVTYTPATSSCVPLSGGMLTDRDPPSLCFPSGALRLESVIKHVSRALRAHGCVVDDRVALPALALAIASCGSAKPTVAHVNAFLTRTHAAKLSQHVIWLGTPRCDYDLTLGTFRIRPFVAERILYWANRCGSKYPIDLRELNGYASLESDQRDVQLLECQATDYWVGAA
jgi:hypothetical protein